MREDYDLSKQLKSSNSRGHIENIVDEINSLKELIEGQRKQIRQTNTTVESKSN